MRGSPTAELFFDNVEIPEGKNQDPRVGSSADGNRERTGQSRWWGCCPHVGTRSRTTSPKWRSSRVSTQSSGVLHCADDGSGSCRLHWTSPWSTRTRGNSSTRRSELFSSCRENLLVGSLSSSRLSRRLGNMLTVIDMYTKLSASRAYVYAVARACDAGNVSRQVRLPHCFHLHVG